MEYGSQVMGFINLTLPNDKILARSKLKAFADDNLARMTKFVADRVENNAEKAKKY